MDANLNFSTKEINQNYRIKVNGVDDTGRKLNTLVGVSGLISIVGVDFTNKFLHRAESCLDDSCTCKLRRGLKVTFYVK